MKFNKKIINVLGTPYTITFKTLKEDERLKDVYGYTDNTSKRIVIQLLDDLVCDNKEFFYESVIKHELVHAFLYESGLDECTNNNWAVSEEIVDWIANQLDKLHEAIEKYRQN